MVGPFRATFLLMCLVAGTASISLLGAHNNAEPAATDQTILWLGHFHPILIHYPIALAIMTGVAELLFAWRRNPLYENAAKFMLVAGAILVIPTGLTGFALGQAGDFPDALANYYWWHRFFGILTLFLMLLTCFLRFTSSRKVYLIALVMLIIVVTITAALGGALVWGPDSLTPPFLK